VHVLDAGGQVTQPGLVSDVRAGLGGAVACPVGGGTDAYFADLNRDRPEMSGFEFVAYPISPQVHASDDRTVMENVFAQRDTVATACSFEGTRPVVLTPVTLAERSGGASADPRQRSLFCAAWTIASVAALAGAGAASITYHETSGSLGVVACERPGDVRAFPVYHALADLGECKGGALREFSSSAPALVSGLAIELGDRLCLLVANLTPARRRAELVLAGCTTAFVRTLDHTTATAAMTEPRRFRSRAVPVGTPGGRLSLDLEPYALARVDL
jgi:hypothetical protein